MSVAIISISDLGLNPKNQMHNVCSFFPLSYSKGKGVFPFCLCNSSRMGKPTPFQVYLLPLVFKTLLPEKISYLLCKALFGIFSSLLLERGPSHKIKFIKPERRRENVTKKAEKRNWREPKEARPLGPCLERILVLSLL